MSAPYTLRRYRPDDFNAVAALAVLASSSQETACGQPDVASVDEFQADYGYRNLEAEAWVAERDGRVVGFAAGGVRNQTLTIEGPIVLPDHQRQGIGAALFAHMEADARLAGVPHTQCGVRATNQRGLRFLEKLGYAPQNEVFVYETHQRLAADFAPPAGVTIGELKPRHLVPFLLLMHECFPSYRLPSTPQRLFEPDKMKIFLALDADDKPVGAVTAFFYPEDRIAYIYHLGISEPYRRSGLGRALLISATEWLWESHNPTFVGLSSSDSAGVRHNLFERVGFALQYSLLFLQKPVVQTAKT
jgi:ribosomal protein S18 acetylase RimI-like enzyme